MSLYDYHISKKLYRQNTPFYALIMAAMRRADSINEVKLRAVWPEIWDELQGRYWSPHGALTEDEAEGIKAAIAAGTLTAEDL